MDTDTDEPRSADADPEDQPARARRLARSLRTGELSPARVALRAYCGDPAAAGVLGVSVTDPGDSAIDPVAWLDGLRCWSDLLAPNAWLALFGPHVAAPPAPSSRVLEAFRRFMTAPSDALARELEQAQSTFFEATHWDEPGYHSNESHLIGAMLGLVWEDDVSATGALDRFHTSLRSSLHTIRHALEPQPVLQRPVRRRLGAEVSDRLYAAGKSAGPWAAALLSILDEPDIRENLELKPGPTLSSGQSLTRAAMNTIRPPDEMARIETLIEAVAEFDTEYYNRDLALVTLRFKDGRERNAYLIPVDGGDPSSAGWWDDETDDEHFGHYECANSIDLRGLADWHLDQQDKLDELRERQRREADDSDDAGSSLAPRPSLSSTDRPES